MPPLDAADLNLHKGRSLASSSQLLLQLPVSYSYISNTRTSLSSDMQEDRGEETRRHRCRR